MKKVLIVVMILALMVPASYGVEKPVNRVDDVARVNVETTIQESEHMMFVTKTTSIQMLSLDIEVQTVEANIIVTKGTTSYSSLKAIINKDINYVYNVVEDVEYFPLQMGSGKYKITLLGSNDGRRYRSLSSKEFHVTLKENAVFLSMSQTVFWNLDSDSTILAKALTKALKTDKEKMKAIHKHIVENVKYDYDKVKYLPKGYIPNPDRTIEEGKGICYDFAALFGSMLRSVDIPAKLVKGYSTYTPVYHAWNEVLIDGEWLVIDTSTDSIFEDYNAAYTIAKPEEAYQGSKFY